MRKTNYILKLNQKDYKLCNILKCCQHITEQNALNIISRTRLNKYIKQGVLRKLHVIKNNKNIIIYGLTKKGECWIKRNTDLKGGFYKSSTAPLHNAALSDFFIKNNCTAVSWLTEQQLRELFISTIEHNEYKYDYLEMLRDKIISVPDGAVINTDGSIQIIEVYTSNYTTQNIQSKEEFATAINLPITFIRG